MKNKILASLFVLTFVFATTLSAQTPVTTGTADNVKKTECKHDGKCKDKKAKCCKEGKEKAALFYLIDQFIKNNKFIQSIKNRCSFIRK